jgi:putative addiction module killer protein
MGNWKIDYWEGEQGKKPVEKWLDKLTKDQLKAVAKVVKMLEIAGNDLKMPFSFPLGNGLFELRDKKYGYRIYYCFSGGRLILLLAAGDKSSQQKDIKIARERLRNMGKKAL